MAAFCHHCGVKLPGDSQFCHECGTAIPVPEPISDVRASVAELMPDAQRAAPVSVLEPSPEITQTKPDTPPLTPAFASTKSTFYSWNYIESGRVHRSSSVGAVFHYLLWAAGLFVIGSVAPLFIPWFIGLPLFCLVLIIFAKGRRRYGTRYGACPHCTEMVSISSHLIAINCPICTKRIFVSGEEFRAV